MIWSMKRHATWRCTTMVLLALAGACADKPREFRPLSDGDAAPAYAASTLNGNEVSLASLRGNVVVLNVWATWCLPCKREMPLLDSLFREFADRGVRVVGVSVDAQGSEDLINSFVERNGIGFTILHDGAGQIQSTYKMRGVPETFLIDDKGVLRRHWIGGVDASGVNIRDAVREIL